MIALFTELERRLATFGKTDDTRRVLLDAIRENGWFTEPDILRAIGALRSRMLDERSLRTWLSAYRVPIAVPMNVSVVMAGNLPLVGFFDLLCVVASGHRCLVKPSSKDRVLIHYVVNLLRQIDPGIPVIFDDGTKRPDAVIATGSDNANRYFRSRYAGIPALLRGSRQSVAVLSGLETPEQRDGLNDDIFAYSGLGCRSVSLLFLPRGCEPELAPPPMPAKYHNNYLQQRALLTLSGRPFTDCGEALLIPGRAFPTALGCVAYSCYDSLEEVASWLAAHDGELQCVVTECLPHSRRVAFGTAQYPALTDYPDDRDVMEFLTGLA